MIFNLILTIITVDIVVKSIQIIKIQSSKNIYVVLLINLKYVKF